MSETSLGGENAAFQETVWSSVLRARDDGAALGRLIERSWKPIYYYLRRKGKDVETSKDLTQAFFAHLIERRLLAGVESGRGRFRSFLLAALEHFLANEYRIAGAEKRGGNLGRYSLDFVGAESRYEPSLAETPEDLYRRAWAADLLQEALDELRTEFGERFRAASRHLSPEVPRVTYRETARELGMSEFDVANLLHKMRVRLGELILRRVRDTVEGDPRGEIADLLSALGRKN